MISFLWAWWSINEFNKSRACITARASEHKAEAIVEKEGRMTF